MNLFKLEIKLIMLEVLFTPPPPQVQEAFRIGIAFETQIGSSLRFQMKNVKILQIKSGRHRRNHLGAFQIFCGYFYFIFFFFSSKQKKKDTRDAHKGT